MIKVVLGTLSPYLGLSSHGTLLMYKWCRYKDQAEWIQFDYSTSPAVGCEIEYVNVKFATNYWTYSYDTGSATSDTCLRSDGCKGISHATFCPPLSGSPSGPSSANSSSPTIETSSAPSSANSSSPTTESSSAPSSANSSSPTTESSSAPSSANSSSLTTETSPEAPSSANPPPSPTIETSPEAPSPTNIYSNEGEGGDGGLFPTLSVPADNTAWQISKPAESSVQFNDDEPEIRAIFRISTPQANSETMQINFLDFDTCEDVLYNPYLNESIGTAEIVPGTGDAFSDVPVNITFVRTMVEQAPSWSWTNTSETVANFQFCARVDLLADEDGFDFSATPEEHFGNNVLEPILFRSVSYIKVLYNLTVDMTQNFEVMIETEEVLSADDVQEAKVEYNIMACHCEYNTKDCFTPGSSPALPQNSLLNICVEVDQTEDIVISNIWQYSLQQGSLDLNMISDGNANSLTSVVDAGKKRVMISSQLISVFYTDDSLDVMAGGIAILKFANTNRRELATIDLSGAMGRDLQVFDGEGSFTMAVELRGSVEGDVEGKASEQFDASSSYGMSNVFFPIVFTISAFTMGMTGPI